MPVPMADVQILLDDSSIVPFNLGDVQLFVSRRDTRNNGTPVTDLVTVNPFTGTNEQYRGYQNFEINDISFRDNGALFGYSQGLERTTPTTPEDAFSGHFIQINPDNGGGTDLGDDGIQTYHYKTPGDPTVVERDHIINQTAYGYGIQFETLAFGALAGNGNGQRLVAVGNRGEEYGFATASGRSKLLPATLFDDLPEGRSRFLFRLDR